MSFSKLRVVKQQISQDRGVTWRDTGELCEPKVMGVYPTLLACLDSDCDLEEYRYDLIDGELPTEICGSGTSLEFGIAKVITFTDGMIQCGYIDGARFSMYPYQDANLHITDLMIADDNGYYTMDVNGGKIENGCKYSCCQCCDLCSCFRIDEFMPWVGNTLKVIRKTHWTREHCTDEWVKDVDYGDVIVGVGERWYPTLDVENANFKWQHQIASELDDEGNFTWIDQGQPISTELGFDIPSGATFLPSASGKTFVLNYVGRLHSDITVVDATDMECPYTSSGIYYSGNPIPVVETSYIDDGNHIEVQHNFKVCSSDGLEYNVSLNDITRIDNIPIGEYVSVSTPSIDTSTGFYSQCKYHWGAGVINGSIRYYRGIATWVTTQSKTAVKSVAITYPQSCWGEDIQSIFLPMELNGNVILVDTKSRIYFTSIEEGRYDGSWPPNRKQEF